jgi:ABC-type thiamine transport system substrate-binding protein
MKAVIVALVVLFACICVAQASVTDLTEDSFASSIKQGKWLVKLYVKQPHTGVECE